MVTQTIIYHICKADEWRAAQETGFYAGSSQDKADGFIHFSTTEQIQKSAARHRCGQDGLILLWVNTDLITGSALKWEKSRADMLFPHLYGPLNLDAVIRTDPLNLDSHGNHVFPPDFSDGSII